MSKSSSSAAPIAEAEWAFVALGSNLGDRAAHLAYAREALARLPHTALVAASTIDETEPLGQRPQPKYLNQMVLLRTGLDPQALLDQCQVIEEARGRVRAARWASRTLDIDIVRFGTREVTSPSLAIPHPALPARPFWQRELAELLPHAR